MNIAIVRFLVLLTALLVIETESRAQAPTAIKYDPEILLEALDLNPTEGLLLDVNGCASIVPLKNDDAKISNANIRWSGLCTHGLADGLGKYSVDGPSSILNMGLYPNYIFPYKAEKGSIRHVLSNEDYYETSGSVDFLDVSDFWERSYKILKFSGGKFDSGMGILRGIVHCEYLSIFTESATKNIISTSINTGNNRAIIDNCRKSKNKTKSVFSYIGEFEQNGLTSKENIYLCNFHESYEPIKNYELQIKNEQNFCHLPWIEFVKKFTPFADAALMKERELQAIYDARAELLRRNLPALYVAVISRRDAAIETNIAAENQMRGLANAASIEQIAKRQTAFLATNRVANPGLAFAAKPFVRPADTSKVGVIVVGHGLGGPTAFKYDLDALELKSGFPVEKVSGQAAPEKFAEAVALLKIAGAETLYVIDFQRVALAQALVGFTPEKRTVVVSSTTSANPRFAQTQADLRQARADLSSAQSEYENFQRNPGAYGPGTSGAIITAATGIAISNRYSQAQTRVEELELSLRSMAQQTTSKKTAIVSMGDVKVRSRMEARLTVFACSLSTGACGEKERLISDDNTVSIPQFIFLDDPSAVDLNKRADEAYKIMYQGMSEKMEFGFSGDEIGNFVDGTIKRIPLLVLPKYLDYANKSFFAKIDEELDSIFVSEEAINDQLMKIGDELNVANISYEDSSNRVAEALDARKETLRKQKLQTLE